MSAQLGSSMALWSANGQLGEHLVVDVDVVGRPAPVAILHREQPVDAAADRRLVGRLVRQRRPLEGPGAPSRYRRGPDRTRCGTGSASRWAPRPGRRICQSPECRTSLASSHSTARSQAGWSAGRPASARQSWRWRCPRPARGTAAPGPGRLRRSAGRATAPAPSVTSGDSRS